jgi:hypothetical protein
MPGTFEKEMEGAFFLLYSEQTKRIIIDIDEDDNHVEKECIAVYVFVT